SAESCASLRPGRRRAAACRRDSRSMREPRRDEADMGEDCLPDRSESISNNRIESLPGVHHAPPLRFPLACRNARRPGRVRRRDHLARRPGEARDLRHPRRRGKPRRRRRHLPHDAGRHGGIGAAGPGGRARRGAGPRLCLADLARPRHGRLRGRHRHPGPARAAPPDPAKPAPFDSLAAEASRDGDAVTFRMTLAATAGSERPAPVGALAGAPVHAYVWPTSLDPATVGFEGGTGILALAATSHPDFDDTPLEDEDGDGDPKNDGGPWHSHWVVLTPSEECGPGALSVRDIPEGETPALPKTWPGLPLFIDSPGYVPA